MRSLLSAIAFDCFSASAFSRSVLQHLESLLQHFRIGEEIVVDECLDLLLLIRAHLGAAGRGEEQDRQSGCRDAKEW